MPAPDHSGGSFAIPVAVRGKSGKEAEKAGTTSGRGRGGLPLDVRPVGNQKICISDRLSGRQGSLFRLSGKDAGKLCRERIAAGTG